MLEYHRIAQRKQKPELGTAIMTESGGGNAKFLLHVVTIDADENQAFQSVHNAFLKALNLAAKSGLSSIAAPALGTGDIGVLTPAQSARAMLSAVNEYAKKGKEMQIKIMIFNDPSAQAAFNLCIRNGNYIDSTPEIGSKGPNLLGMGISLNQSMMPDKKSSKK